MEGFNNIARDEHRHVAFGARFLREMAQADTRYAEAITRVLGEVAPIADAVLRPKWYVEGETELFGTDLEETRAFAAKALERRLKVIGLAPAARRKPRPDRSDMPQNIRPPTGTSAVGRSRITLPSSSGTPRVSTSDMNGPIWRGGKFTTATTRLPSSSSRV